MKNGNSVSIIIPNWNGGKSFYNCIKSLSKVKYNNLEIIIVDNGSVDKSESLVYKFSFSKIRVIKNLKNLGFAKACNIGFLKSSGDYILFLNNDTKVTPDFLNVLVNFIKNNPEVGAIQPKIKILNRPSLLDNAGSFLTNSGFLEHWGYMKKDSREFNNAREVFSIKGACLLTRRGLIEKIGLFDEDFESYFEESDFCWRVWMQGYKIVYYPKTFIYHEVGFSSKKQNQYFVFFHSSKNRISSLIKNMEFKNLLAIGGLHLILNLGLVLYYCLKLKFKKAFMIVKAIVWNILHINKIVQKRIHIQNERIVTDKEIFKVAMKKFDFGAMIKHFAKVEANFK